MRKKLKQPKSNMPSAVDPTPGDAIQITPADSASVVKAKTTRPRVQKHLATAAVADPAADAETIDMPQVIPQATAMQTAMALDLIDMPEAEMNTVAVGVMAAVPPMPPELAALIDEINSRFCDLKRLAKAATCIGVELGERLGDLFDHAPNGEWNVLVGRTAVHVADAAALVVFAEDRHALVERLSPVHDVPLREVLMNLTTLANALALTSSSQQQTNSDRRAEQETDIRAKGAVVGASAPIWTPSAGATS